MDLLDTKIHTAYLMIDQNHAISFNIVNYTKCKFCIVEGTKINERLTKAPHGDIISSWGVFVKSFLDIFPLLFVFLLRT